MRTASGTFSPNFPVRVRCSLVKTPKMFHCTKLPHTDGESPMTTVRRLRQPNISHMSGAIRQRPEPERAVFKTPHTGGAGPKRRHDVTHASENFPVREANPNNREGSSYPSEKLPHTRGGPYRSTQGGVTRPFPAISGDCPRTERVPHALYSRSRSCNPIIVMPPQSSALFQKIVPQQVMNILGCAMKMVDAFSLSSKGLTGKTP